LQALSGLFCEGAIMRLALLAVPASLLLVASQATAQSGSYPLQETAPVATVEVTAPFQLTEEESETVRGMYAMSNGWRLKISPRSNSAITAQIDKERPMRLIAITPDKFVSPDGNVTMDFNRGDYGDEMLMTYVPNPRLAVRYEIRATMAQR
jgi:hypothetical protein